MKKVLLLVCIIGLTNILFAQNDTTYYGVSLAGAEFGNTFPGVYNVDYTYPTTDELDYYQSKGIILIRLPIKWERIQQSLNGNIDAVELGRLTSFIENIRIRNMKVLIDIHNYCRYSISAVDNLIGSSAVSTANITDLWIKLSTILKSYNCIWGYGIMNEPHDMLNNSQWKDIAQSIITGIRTKDKTTTIVVGGDSWSSAERWPTLSDNLKTLSDPNNNLIFEAHCYFDNDASGTYANSYDADGITLTTGINRVKPFVNWLKTNHFRGFVGEYGIPNNDSRWLPVLDTFLVYLKSNHIGGSYWAGGPWWGGYGLTCEPNGSTDASQMSILENFSLDIKTNEKIIANDGISSDQIYPNPCKSFVQIKGKILDNSLLEIFNNQGINIYSTTIQSLQTIDIGFLPNGLYLFRINHFQSFEIIKN
jgi:endoglucanase